MILVASERGSAKELARHLLNDKDGNEHISVHELRGFMSNKLEGALQESEAIAKGTKCRKHLFSVSFNPPAQNYVSIEDFEDAINRVEEKNDLNGHARAIVFHEKEGRRHAHAVWSRIDAETMRAKNLSHYKLKLQSISRELYHEHEWKMPQGLARKGHSDPRNYTLSEYQQAKRMKIDARELKGAVQDAYAASDNAQSFAHALSERGLILAKGDRRGHVAVSHTGDVLSIARYVGKKAKEVRAKLGEPENLPSVDEAKIQMMQDMRKAFIRHAQEAKSQAQLAKERLEQEKWQTIQHQREDRQKLEDSQKQRWIEETKARSDRLNSGLRGLWQRITGQRAAIQRENEEQARQALERDLQQKNNMIAKQMQARKDLQDQQTRVSEQHHKTLQGLKDDQAAVREQLRELREKFQQEAENTQQNSTPSKSNTQQQVNYNAPEPER